MMYEAPLRSRPREPRRRGARCSLPGLQQGARTLPAWTRGRAPYTARSSMPVCCIGARRAASGCAAPRRTRSRGAASRRLWTARVAGELRRSAAANERGRGAIKSRAFARPSGYADSPSGYDARHSPEVTGPLFRLSLAARHCQRGLQVSGSIVMFVESSLL